MCLEHCERIFAICGDIPVDGHAVSKLYTSGRHFCEVHGYEVVEAGQGEAASTGQACFNAASRNSVLGGLAGAFASLAALLGAAR